MLTEPPNQQKRDDDLNEDNADDKCLVIGKQSFGTWYCCAEQGQIREIERYDENQ
jgi:hypothetical protein